MSSSESFLPLIRLNNNESRRRDQLMIVGNDEIECHHDVLLPHLRVRSIDGHTVKSWSSPQLHKLDLGSYDVNTPSHSFSASGVGSSTGPSGQIWQSLPSGGDGMHVLRLAPRQRSSFNTPNALLFSTRLSSSSERNTASSSSNNAVETRYKTAPKVASKLQDLQRRLDVIFNRGDRQRNPPS
jgi:hypothetical protein